jgi:predicted ATPase/DNA-binding winged helix-turn-helix (wHTH) protein
MSVDRAICFGRYHLHPTQGLSRGKQEVRVTAKSLSVLCVLAQRPGQVVTKDELFRMVWPDTAVTDAALTSCIKELRHALRDDARRPRYIETLHRRGYRFIAAAPAVLPAEPEPAPGAHFLHAAAAPLFGRAADIEEMLGALASAEQGARQLLFVTGEPGVGKTSLVETFVATATARDSVRVTWGQCVEHYGPGEAYQPLLEALARLCRPAGGEEFVAVLRQYAPTWLAQLPAVQAPAQLAALRRTTAGATPERMLRELTDALEAMTTRAPMILWLEDLHWSDVSTLDWIAAFAQRPERAQLLLIGTYRPAEQLGAAYPLSELTDGLRVRGFCREIALGGLDEAAVADYVAFRFPPAPGAREGLGRLAHLVHQRTEGNPLFVVNVLGDLAARGLLASQEDGWAARGDPEVEDLGIPEDVRRVIERQLERIAAAERSLLEAASVAGETFSAAAAASGAGSTVGEAERALGTLARQRRFVREAGGEEWPDGMMAARFAFFHALYRDALYQWLPAGRRAELHRLVGAHEEAAHGERAPEIAAELAMHFERGGDRARAVFYLQHAGETARRRSAHREAQMHFERALALLARQPAGPERDEQEVALQSALGSVLMATRGFGAPEVESAYARARALCQAVGDTPRLFPALWGLWLFYWARGSLGTAHELANSLLALARQSAEPGLLLQAYHALWATSFSQGDLRAAAAQAAEGMALYDAHQHAAMAVTYGNHDAGACSRYFRARALALLGCADEAVRMSDDAIALARNLAHPFSLALALTFAAAVHQLRRDPTTTEGRAAEAATIARAQGFRLILAWASPLEGWAIVQRGEHEEGLGRIREGVAGARATGEDQFVPHLLGLLAEGCLRSGRADAGLQAIEEALSIVRRTGERFHEAELHRVRGELLLAAAPAGAARDAAEAFRRAIEVARSQGAKLLVLRAAVSLGRLWRDSERDAEARALLAEACAGITEGLDLLDVTEAKALLAG